MTPDWATTPIDVPYADFGNPQSLNLYSYVKNNPTTTRDPDGHCRTVPSISRRGMLPRRQTATPSVETIVMSLRKPG